MKYPTTIFLFVAALVLPVSVFAHSQESPDGEEALSAPTIEPCEIGSVIKCGGHGNDGHSQSIDAVINDLLIGFDVESVKDLRCEDIVSHDFEHVGEAFMSYMHPDEEEHHRIDDLFGGEGSESLDKMHEFMGRRYLGCEEGAFGPMMMNFGNDFRHGGGMMGNQLFGDGGRMMGGSSIWIFQGVIWVLAILGVVWIIQAISGKKK